MSENTPLEVTLELPATELLDHDNGLFVRCPANGNWIPLVDYYSENAGSLLPLVGKASYQESLEHWDIQKNEKGEDVIDATTGLPVMVKVAKENPLNWSEVVRILPPVVEAPAEGGTHQLGASEDVGTGDKM